MNRERLMDLANIIERDELPNVVFDMAHVAVSRPDVHPVCGTAACIAGYVLCAAYGNLRAKKFEYAKEPGEILGLSGAEASALFMPPQYWDNKTYTKERAVRVLRHAAKTGKIDWSV